MFKVAAPFLFLPTAQARAALGGTVAEAARAAFREVSFAARGLEIAHLQFDFRGLTLAVCSRVRRDGQVEIEAGLGDPSLPVRVFTSRQLQEAEQAARVRDALHRRNARAGRR